MKIAVMYTPELKNIGNSLINKGADILLNKTFGWKELHKIEALETGNNSFNYPTKSITDYNKKIIEHCDWLIVLGGSCLSRYMINFFEEVKQLRVKKILLGVGFYEGLEKEMELHKDLPKYFDYIFARDDETAEALQQGGTYGNIYSGLDTAFWIDEYKDDLLPVKIDRNYSVINIDSPERGALQERLCNENEDHIISRNNPYLSSICNSHLGKEHKCFVAEKWYEYIRLYANARYVATNRVHTFLTCILFDTPCQPFIDYTASYERFFLFKQMGLKLETAKKYMSEDYVKVSDILKWQKTKMEDKLTQVLCKH